MGSQKKITKNTKHNNVKVTVFPYDSGGRLPFLCTCRCPDCYERACHEDFDGVLMTVNWLLKRPNWDEATQGMHQPTLVHVTQGILRNDELLKDLVGGLVDGNGVVTLALVDGINKEMCQIIGEATALWDHHEEGGYMSNLHDNNPHPEEQLVGNEVKGLFKKFIRTSVTKLASTWPDESSTSCGPPSSTCTSEKAWRVEEEDEEGLEQRMRMKRMEDDEGEEGANEDHQEEDEEEDEEEEEEEDDEEEDDEEEDEDDEEEDELDGLAADSNSDSDSGSRSVSGDDAAYEPEQKKSRLRKGNGGGSGRILARPFDSEDTATGEDEEDEHMFEDEQVRIERLKEEKKGAKKKAKAKAKAKEKAKKKAKAKKATAKSKPGNGAEASTLEEEEGFAFLHSSEVFRGGDGGFHAEELVGGGMGGAAAAAREGAADADDVPHYEVSRTYKVPPTIGSLKRWDAAMMKHVCRSRKGGPLVIEIIMMTVANDCPYHKGINQQGNEWNRLAAKIEDNLLHFERWTGKTTVECEQTGKAKTRNAKPKTRRVSGKVRGLPLYLQCPFSVRIVSVQCHLCPLSVMLVSDKNATYSTLGDAPPNAGHALIQPPVFVSCACTR